MIVLLQACGNGGGQQFSSDIRVLNRQIINDAKAGIQTGDVIMRSGKDFTSYRIRELSDKDKTYSHAGMAIVKDTSVYIYHITPPDLDEPKADTAMRLEPLEKFASPNKCFGFGIVRYQLTAEETTAAVQYLDSLYKKKVSFDHYFNLDEANKMYCSEMVDNTLRYATHGRIMLAKKYFTKLQAAKASRYFHRSMQDVSSTPYISIDNMQLNPYATAIHNYVFLK
ncbi:MAG: hypothetical protein ABIQ88_10280 [Chitinophagaceae bacterium]